MLGFGTSASSLLLLFIAIIYNACVSQDISDDNPVMEFAFMAVIVGPCLIGLGLILICIGFCVFGTEMVNGREPPAVEVSLEEGKAGQRCHADWPQ
jgi:hypothetical protein